MSETTTAASTATTTVTRSPKTHFQDAFQREHATTLKVLRAYPEDHSELQPHPTSATARQLAWVFVLGQGVMAGVLTNKMKFDDPNTPPQQPPAAPPTFGEVIAAYEKAVEDTMQILENTPDSTLLETARFPVGPKKLADVQKIQLLWYFLNDAIHHRGQLSVYLRMSGGKVPSIYGPSRDEPWF
jgi:uncharacterized damage-inducible protein DinB